MSLKSFVFRFIYSNKLINIFNHRLDNKIAILVAHHLHTKEQVGFRQPPNNSILLEDFRKNILILQRNYSIISLDKAIDMLEGRLPWKKRCAVLTFDDSMKCNITLAAPLLSELKINATFYISTDAIDNQQPYWWYRLTYAFEFRKRNVEEIVLTSNDKLIPDYKNIDDSLLELKKRIKWLPYNRVNQEIDGIEKQLGSSLLSIRSKDPFSALLAWDDVKKLIEMNMTIGCHTINHHNITIYNDDEFKKEIIDSRKIIQERCGYHCNNFSFPYGIYSNKSCIEVKNAGYRSAVTMKSPGWNSTASDRYALCRFGFPKIAYKLPYILSGWHQKV